MGKLPFGLDYPLNVLSEMHLIITLRYKFKNPRPSSKPSSRNTRTSEAGGH